MPCPLLTDLAEELLAYWTSPEWDRRRRLWADHWAGRTREVPVSCSMFQGSQDLVWQQILPEDTFHHQEGMARQIEIHLRHRLWRARNILDDVPLDPLLTLSAVPELPPDELWGVPIEFHSTGQAGGANKPVPPLQRPEDLDKVRAPVFRADEEKARREAEQVRELVGERLPTCFVCDPLHNGPFEWAVRLRGMDSLLLDCYDRPEWLHELMRRVSEGMVQYHRDREAAGYVCDRSFRVLHTPWEEWPDGEQPRLDHCWGYLHAQSAASYGPATYAEFIQPYNVPLAELFGKVYYHGCEDLTRKVGIIRELPHLAQFHVSPWSQVAPIAAALPEHVTMEVHSHPTNVLFLWDAAQMREELERLVRDAGDHLFNLKLCDIQTLNHDAGEALRTWAQEAKEAGVRGIDKR
jgi:hypothetical protein